MDAVTLADKLARLARIRAVVEDTKLSPKAALDTIRAILEEE